MARYKLSKAQIKRLLEDKPVVDGHGIKYLASPEVKARLQRFDEDNLYDKLNVIMDNGALSIEDK